MPRGGTTRDWTSRSVGRSIRTCREEEWRGAAGTGKAFVDRFDNEQLIVPGGTPLVIICKRWMRERRRASTLDSSPSPSAVAVAVLTCMRLQVSTLVVACKLQASYCYSQKRLRFPPACRFARNKHKTAGILSIPIHGLALPAQRKWFDFDRTAAAATGQSVPQISVARFCPSRPVHVPGPAPAGVVMPINP